MKPCINREKLKQVVVRAGQFVKFDVDIKGEPAPTIQWIFAGAALESKDRLKIENAEDGHNTKFALGETERKDTGVYTLVAENSVGKDEATVNVNILGKPGKPEEIKVKDVLKDRCKLVWEKPKDDGGLPLTSFVLEKMELGTGKWVPVGKSDADKPTEMEVLGLEPGKKYHFRVKAVNEEGEGEPMETESAILAKNPFDVPLPPGLPDIIDWSETMVKLRWEQPIRDGGAPITGYVIEMMDKMMGTFVKCAEVTGNVCQGTVNNLEEGNRYEFRVRAVNKAGQSEPSDSTKPHLAKARFRKFNCIRIIDEFIPLISFSSLASRPSVKPRIDRTNLNNITIKVGQQVDLDVNVAGEPAPAITWTLKEKQLQSNDQIRVDVFDYNTKFLIFRATRAYSGVYTIDAKNEHGVDQATIEILILGTSFSNLFKQL